MALKKIIARYDKYFDILFLKAVTMVYDFKI